MMRPHSHINRAMWPYCTAVVVTGARGGYSVCKSRQQPHLHLIMDGGVSIITSLEREFEMTNLGLLPFFLGFKIWQTPNSTYVSQEVH